MHTTVIHFESPILALFDKLGKTSRNIHNWLILRDILNEWVADEKVLLLTSMTLDLYCLLMLL